MNVIDGMELDRGHYGTRIIDREWARDHAKQVGWQMDIFDVSSPDMSLLSGKYDGFVFSQHGDLDNRTGFWRPGTADAFIKVAPQLQPFLQQGGWTAWEFCFGQASQSYIDSMKGAMKVNQLILSSGAETGFNAHYGPFVFLGGKWITK